MDQDQIYAELDRVRDDYRGLLNSATVGELRQPTNGTKWNNEQLLFHMLFGVSSWCGTCGLSSGASPLSRLVRPADLRSRSTPVPVRST